VAQVAVSLVGTNNLDRTISILVGNTQVEYFVGDRYPFFLNSIRGWLADGWYNYVIAQLTKYAHHAEYATSETNFNLKKERKKKVSTSIAHQTVPSKEFSFTIIAPTAKSITYNDDRLWFKTSEDARAFAASIYEGNTKKGFELAIVQCMDVVAPKPQIELTSRWAE
jgi:hypothetical protein